jgi:hypothetical protein
MIIISCGIKIGIYNAMKGVTLSFPVCGGYATGRGHVDVWQ